MTETIQTNEQTEEDDDDFLRCVDCGAKTDVTAQSMFDRMGTTKAGKPRKRSGWLKTLGAIVEEWRCNRCLDREDEKQNDTIKDG